jgi:UV DNA damage endonuclease
MLHRLGFVASVLSEDISTSRTCRLKNATAVRLRELIEANLEALDRVVTFLIRERIQLYRISSGLIPLASHSINKVRWWETYEKDLARVGARIRQANIRVSMHPGQYTVLNSPHPHIVAASVDELAYHARLLDALGTDATSKLVLHVGGLYGASEQLAMDRFIAVAERLPEAVLRRLVIENDDRLFDADEVLSISRRLGVPVVFDWLHHHANPTERPVREVIADVYRTWTERDGLPKVHLSTQAADAPAGAHADYVKAGDLLAFLDHAPAQPVDCMLEAKKKDIALLRLRKELRRHGVVEATLSFA